MNAHYRYASTLGICRKQALIRACFIIYLITPYRKSIMKNLLTNIINYIIKKFKSCV